MLIDRQSFLPRINRRGFLRMATAGAASVVAPRTARAQANANGRTPTSSPAQDDLASVRAEITKRHDEALQRLQTWIRQPSIAAENRGMEEGCQLMMEMLREVGFETVKKIPTSGHPSVFAVLDVGAPRTLGIYFMYDVKQADPAEWSSPPFAGALVQKPGLGTVLMGRGATNQKGPEATFLAALHAMRGAGLKLPLNLVFVAEGEEEIGSPHFIEVIRQPEITAAFKKCFGVFMPFPSQDLEGQVTMYLGAKGVVECELVSSGKQWGKGPRDDIHSSYKAIVDSPAWHLVQALATLVSPDGNEPAIEGFAAKARPLSPNERQLIADVANRLNEESTKKLLGVNRWVRDAGWVESLERLTSRPTINIEGLVGGYTGPGGKTILPGKAVAKLDMRLVPDMTAADAVGALKAHLAKKGFGDIEVNMSGGYDPTSTPADSAIIRGETAVYRQHGINPVILPRLAGSWPGYVFTGDPLRLPAGHFGLGHGSGAHAPNEYYVIESSNPKIEGMDGAAFSHVELLFELARAT